MSTEVVPQAPVEQPAYNAADVTARAAALFKQPEPQAPPVEQAPVQEATKEKTDTGIPDELINPKESVQEPDWDSIHKEEVKGQVKNEHFKRYKDLTGKKVEALTKELEAIRSKIPKDDYVPEKVSKELESLRKSLQERDEIIGRKYVEESPDFKEKFTSKQGIISKKLETAAEKFNLNKGLIKQLMGADIDKRAELIGDMEINDGAKLSLTSLLNEHDILEEQKGEYMKDWQARREEMEMAHRSREDSEKARIKEYEDKVFESKLAELTKTFGPLQKVEGKDEWNAKIDADIAEARRFYDGEFTPQEYAEVAIAGVVSKRLATMYDHVLSLYRESRKEAESLKGANPSINPDTSKPDQNAGKNNDRWDRNDAMRAFREGVRNRINEVS